MTNTRDMQKRETAARRDAMYDSPSSQRIRAESDRKPGAAQLLAGRHADERARLGDRHRKEVLKLSGDYQRARDKHLTTSRGLPKEMDEDHKNALQAMNDRHGRELKAMKDRHLSDRDAIRAEKRA